MLWQGYFYWFGVIMTVMIVFWFLFGVAYSVKIWTSEREIRKKYDNTVGEAESEKDVNGDGPDGNGGEPNERGEL